MGESSTPPQSLSIWALLILSLCPLAAFLGDLFRWTHGAAACAVLTPAVLAAVVRAELRQVTVVAVLGGACCLMESLLRTTQPAGVPQLGYPLFAGCLLAGGALLAGNLASRNRRENGRLRRQKDRLLRDLYERERTLRSLTGDEPTASEHHRPSDGLTRETGGEAQNGSDGRTADEPDGLQRISGVLPDSHEDNISYAMLLLTLQDISQRVATNLDFATLIPTVISTARASLSCEVCHVWLWNARDQSLTSALPERSRDRDEYRPRATGGMGGWVIDNRHVLTRSDVEDDLALSFIREQEDGHLPDAVAPLAVGGELIGLLVIDRAAEDSARFLRLLYILADIYALGIKNAQLFSHVQQMARHDGLTGLLNHASFRDELDRLLTQATDAQPVAVIMSDIDHFKQVNDTRGHRAGDEVLRQFGSLWKAALPDRAIAARYGGEEFIVAIPDCDLTTAADLAAELRELIASFGVDFEGQTIYITSSLGVMASRSGNETAACLIDRADQSLYAAKHGGRNRVVLWTELESAPHAGQSVSPETAPRAALSPPGSRAAAETDSPEVDSSSPPDQAS